MCEREKGGKSLRSSLNTCHKTCGEGHLDVGKKEEWVRFSRTCLLVRALKKTHIFFAAYGVPEKRLISCAAKHVSGTHHPDRTTVLTSLGVNRSDTFLKPPYSQTCMLQRSISVTRAKNPQRPSKPLNLSPSRHRTRCPRPRRPS